MEDICTVVIEKEDVLMEDFTNINTLISSIASDRQQLLEMINRWEVSFQGYDDDPREITDIPEVVNWIKQSVEKGIPWFYFMRGGRNALELITFMNCFSVEYDAEHPEKYTLKKNKAVAFIKKNLENLEEFTEKYDLPDFVKYMAANATMNITLRALENPMDKQNMSEPIDRNKQIKEAMERLAILENNYDINPKIREDFSEGKLYYSYIIAGFLVSSDTIDYDKRYARAVQLLEEKKPYLVYYVIERGNTISFLFVSKYYKHWLNERPTASGVLAQVVNMNTGENRLGYIKLDTLMGVLYRSNDEVYPYMPKSNIDTSGFSFLAKEIVERLEILKDAGLVSDLDITKVYIQKGEICCSLLQSVLGVPVGVVNRISSSPNDMQLMKMLQQQMSMQIYFLMDSTKNKLAFLTVSENEGDWEIEKLELKEGQPFAVVVDLDEGTTAVEQITITMVNGGPIFES